MEQILETTISTTIEEIIQNSNLLCYDRAALIISIISIIISIWSVIWSDRKSNKHDYKNKLYETVLQNALQEELPILMQKSIDINSKTVNDDEINKFDAFIENLRNSILIFKYTDFKFYENLDNIIVKIDEELVLISTRQKNFDKIYSRLTNEVSNLYKCTQEYLFK